MRLVVFERETETETEIKMSNTEILNVNESEVYLEN
jgi:hypothetical protein